jgi:hypothetical protein
VGLGLSIAVRSASLLSVLAVVLVLSGCGDATNSARSHAPQVEVSKPANSVRSRKIRPRELRLYLSAWEASWRRLLHDLEGGDEGALGFSSTPDSSWKRARRLYDAAATAYRHDERRLVTLAPPSAMRKAHDAYLAAIGRQRMRFQTLADAFGGNDPEAMERALDGLQTSQMKFDLDGAQWEQAVITACNANSSPVPESVRLELISNGQRTNAR